MKLGKCLLLFFLMRLLKSGFDLTSDLSIIIISIKYLVLYRLHLLQQRRPELTSISRDLGGRTQHMKTVLRYSVENSK